MGKLYVVPTPVGNLEDMTFRAIKVLKEVDLILAEDTRTSGILLKHFEIKNAMQSHHKFNEHKTVESVVNRIKAGETVALISDAGTPGLMIVFYLDCFSFAFQFLVRTETDIPVLRGIFYLIYCTLTCTHSSSSSFSSILYSSRSIRKTS